MSLIRSLAAPFCIAGGMIFYGSAQLETHRADAIERFALAPEGVTFMDSCMSVLEDNNLGISDTVRSKKKARRWNGDACACIASRIETERGTQDTYPVATDLFAFLVESHGGDLNPVKAIPVLLNIGDGHGMDQNRTYDIYETVTSALGICAKDKSV